MPIYEYRCQGCDQLFQKLQSVSAGTKGITCPSCGSPRVERQLSVFASTSRAGAAATPASGCAPAGGG
ncbi:MAG: zinc ribbon domain-containing protein [Holophagae bacterium]|nr:MAG: zinc ribbon domain-containing protein [Holophagae bacterium]